MVEILAEPAEEEEPMYEEVVVVKKRGRGRPKKIKEEDLENEGTYLILAISIVSYESEMTLAMYLLSDW